MELLKECKIPIKLSWTKCLKMFQRVGKNHRTLPLTIIDEITDEPSPLKSFRELEKNCRTCHY
jgi:hypothetical protein